MNKPLFLLLQTGFLSLAGALPAADKTASLQEGIELRRIAEYSKEKNFSAVKTQIHVFLKKHPVSDSKDALYAMLGDIHFSENDFADALNAYNHIKKDAIQSKTEFRRIHCLHQLAQFQELILATNAFLKKQTSPDQELPTLRLQLANALFRESLSIEDREKRQQLTHLAKEQFKLLSNTEYADQALAPLAHIYTFLKEYPQAVKMYQLLVEKDSKNTEEYLLQSLQLQLKFDRNAAIETCQKIYSLSGTFAPQAAFNQLSLLFQEKRYRDIALFQDKTLKYISQEYLSIAHYYIGRSLYHIGDYVQAAVNVEKYLNAAKEDNSRTKNALLTLLQCAKEIDDFSLFEKTLSHIKTAYPKDSETVKAILLHTQLCRNKGLIHQASQNLKGLLETHSELPEKDHILYDYALLLSKEEQWLDSACAFETCIKQFPAHPAHQNAWRNLIQCHFNAIKASSPETAFVKKEKLCHALTLALREKGIFSPEERKAMHFTLASTLFDMQKYESCLGELSEYTKNYHNDVDISDAHMLTALAHYNGTKDLDLFISYAEKTLGAKNTRPEASKLHLHLFNTYLTLAEKKEAEVKNTMLLKAADHLYQVLDSVTKKENILWLADFYFHQYKESHSKESLLYLDRSIVVLEKILNFSPEKGSLHIPADKLEMEAEAIKLSELYLAKNKNQDRIHLLEALTSEYKAHPDFTWKYQRLAHFDLATTYSQEKQYDQALAAYTFLIDSSSHAASYFATAAQLDKTLLEFSLLPTDQKKEEAAPMQAICDALKDLEIKRKLFSEPFHMEAALSYIELMTELCAEDQKTERRLLLFNQLNDNLSREEDPLVAKYLSTKADFPEKYTLYEQYMNFISAEILAVRASLSHKKGEKDQYLYLSHKAMDELIVLSSVASHPRLQQRIEKSREALKRIL